MNDITIREIDKGRVEYFLAGGGPTVLIVHGGHDSCRGNYRQQELVEKGFSVLIPSRPGYRGTPITSGKTAEATADLFAALLKTLGITRVIVLGNSAGGPVALEFARKYPYLVEKLILEAAVVKPWFHRFTFQYYGSKIIFHPKRQRKFWDNMIEKVEKDQEKTLIHTLKLFTKGDPQVVFSRLNDNEREELKYATVTGNDSGEGFFYDVEHRAKNIDEITCPTLIIHSRSDNSVPFSHAEYAHRKIKNSELYEAPTDSHFLYLGPGSEKVLEKRMAFIGKGESLT